MGRNARNIEHTYFFVSWSGYKYESANLRAIKNSMDKMREKQRSTKIQARKSTDEI
jgi:hypothetical protein